MPLLPHAPLVSAWRSPSGRLQGSARCVSSKDGTRSHAECLRSPCPCTGPRLSNRASSSRLRLLSPLPQSRRPADQGRLLLCAVRTVRSGSQANLSLENQVYGELGFEQETELP